MKKKNLFFLLKTLTDFYILMLFLCIVYVFFHFAIGLRYHHLNVNVETIITVSLELFASLLMICIFFYEPKSFDMKYSTSHFFLWMVTMTQTALVCDALSYGVGFAQYFFASTVRQVGYYGAHLIVFFIIQSCSYYLISFVEKKEEYIHYIYIISILCICGVFFVITTIFTVKNRIHPWFIGDHYHIYLFFVFLPTIACLCLVFSLLFSTHQRFFLRFLLCILIVIFAVTLDVLFQTCLSYVFISFVLFFLYITFHKDYEQKQIQNAIIQEREAKDNLQTVLRVEKKQNDEIRAFLINLIYNVNNHAKSISYFSDLANHYIDDKQKVVDRLTKIQNSSKDLQNLLNAIMLYVKFVNGNETFREEFTDIIEESQKNIQFVKEFADAKSVVFESQVYNIRTENVYFDKLLVNQMLLVVLYFAIKHAQNNSKIIYKILQLDDITENISEYMYSIIIKESSLSMDGVQQIYENFDNVDYTILNSNNFCGVEVFLAKKFVDILGGRIEMHSNSNRATEIKIFLQYKKTI